MLHLPYLVPTPLFVLLRNKTGSQLGMLRASFRSPRRRSDDSQIKGVCLAGSPLEDTVGSLEGW
jgi:hypothetical protein